MIRRSPADTRPAPRGVHAASPGESAWRDKLAGYARFLDAPLVDIADPRALTGDEHRALSARLDAANMALYRVAPGVPVDHAAVLSLGRQFGLARPWRNLCAGEDAVSDITRRDGAPARYAPYTDHALGWHTDGCYEPDGGVRAFILHCMRQSAEGGGNRFLDHEILHGLLRRDAGIDVDALYEEDAYRIPANVVEGIEIRAATRGAVFARIDGALVMRFSARQRHIAFKDDPRVRAAVAAIRHYLDHSPLVLSVRLEPCMGILCRNVPHCRDAFVDRPGAPRLLLRSRYHDAITSAALSGTARDLA